MSCPVIFIVVGLGFGDEGKGSIVDKLCRETGADTVVRFNGGAQAAHNVCLPDGTHHTFAQFGSGSYVRGVRTILSRHMIVNPSTFLVEADVLGKTRCTTGLVTADRDALVTTPYHVVLNCTRERARGITKHGTTGLGISETVLDGLARKDAMRCRDLAGSSKMTLHAKLMAVRDALEPEMARLGSKEFERLSLERIVERFQAFANAVAIESSEEIYTRLRNARGIIFEGAQGILLDQDFGFHPHTTWSRTTPVYALELLAEDAMLKDCDRQIVGVTRCYTTRHGEGPFPTEIPLLGLPELHNGDTGMAGPFRRGWLDLPLLKYACRCCSTGITRLAINHVDYAPDYYCVSNPHLDVTKLPVSITEQEALCRQAWTRVTEYERTPEHFPQAIAEHLGVQLWLVGDGPTYDNKHIQS